MSKRTRSNAAEQIDFAEKDEALLDGLDGLVRDAAQGGQGALGILAITFMSTLNDEAKEELGAEWEQDSGDVVQELFLAMCEGSLVFPAIRGAALPWLRRMIREIAREWVKRRLREQGPGAAE